VSLHHGNCKKLFFLLVTILKNAFRQTMSSCAKTTGAGGPRDGGVEQGVEAGVEEAIATVGAARNSELDDIYPASDLQDQEFLRQETESNGAGGGAAEESLSVQICLTLPACTSPDSLY
jgi:hypothetical protein